MQKRIFRSLFLLALSAILLTSALVTGAVGVRSYRALRDELRRESAMLSAGFETAGDAYLTVLPESAGLRVTRIAADGAVLFDSSAALDTLENHLHRPEMQAVLAGAAIGEASRRSATLGVTTLYCARQLSDGTVLRVSADTGSALGSIRAAMPMILLAAGFVLLLTYVLARRIADELMNPILAIDPAHPPLNAAYEELSPLLARLSEQNRVVRRQLQELSARQEEFLTLSENMSEGLLLLGPNAEIFSVNRAACRILGGDPARDWRTQHLLMLSRDLMLQQLTKDALQGERAEGLLEAHGRQFELIASPVSAPAGEAGGALLLLLDVTERLQAEQRRREFSANVSHELKTPLTSISGYAELMASGRVRAGDICGFAARIHGESGRLLALIEDILKLSRLDEESAPPVREPVDLAALLRLAAERLELMARQHDVTITIRGASAVVFGASGQLFELVLNLAENAVKYNRPGGCITLSVEAASNETTLTVSDTGIGIPLDAQTRIFERFYRVDKSRSKETGGTGLGLSIVKHIALLHGATIALQSAPGEGTTISVHFPAS